MDILGKKVSELARVTEVTDDALLPVDNGGAELNSIFVSDLLNGGQDVVANSVKEQNNDNHMKEWVGTQREYDAIEEKDANTIYFVNDNQTPTPEELDNLLNLLQMKQDKIFWTTDTFVNLRHKLFDLDWKNTYIFQSVEDKYGEITIPMDGLLCGLLSYNGAININGYIYSTSTTDSNWGGSYTPIFVNKGDIVKARFNKSYTKLVPFKTQGGNNNLLLGLQFFGKFESTTLLNEASSSFMNTALGQGRWALVGNDIDGYVRYYTKPSDNTFTSYEWASGGKDTYLGNEADYVVSSKKPTETDPTWYRVYKSGWCEQGGALLRVGSNNHITVNFLKEFRDTNYSIVKSPAWYHADSTYGRNLNFYTRTTKSADTWDTNVNNSGAGFTWEARGQLKEGEY